MKKNTLLAKAQKLQLVKTPFGRVISSRSQPFKVETTAFIFWPVHFTDWYMAADSSPGLACFTTHIVAFFNWPSGCISYCAFTLVLTIWGVVVDRFPKKKILYFTQSANMVLALILGIFTNMGLASVPVIGTIAF